MLDHLADLESDFSAIHHRDWRTMASPQFFRMAERLPAYQGMMRVVVEREADRRQKHFGTTEVIPLTAGMARDVPEFDGLIEYSTVTTTN